MRVTSASYGFRKQGPKLEAGAMRSASRSLIGPFDSRHGTGPESRPEYRHVDFGAEEGKSGVRGTLHRSRSQRLAAPDISLAQG